VTDIVREGYERIAGRFDDWKHRIVDAAREERLALLETLLPDGARILELGCGSGEEAHRLARRFRVTGVDISAAQLRLAGGIETVEADFTELELPEAAFDACVSFYVFNHVPRERLAALLARMHAWLAPGGVFLHAFGTSDLEAWTGDWLGAPNFFSSFPPEVNARLVRGAGFTIESDELVTLHEPEGDAVFQWILARR